ncbi:MAG: bile acid:sodium symporter [Burkholderiales bacterium]
MDRIANGPWNTVVMEWLNGLLKVSLALFMVGNLLDMGLRLRVDAAWRDIQDVRFSLAALAWGFVILPALAYGIARVVPMAPPFAMGLVLLGLTPCAPFLPPMVDRAKGDIAYTAAFMLLVSVVTIAYMPFAVPMLVHGLQADAWTIAKPLVILLLVPLVVGIMVQKRWPTQAERLHPIVKKATSIDTLLMLVLCVAVYGKGFLDLIGSYAIGSQLLFFSAATVLPFLISFGLPRSQRTVLSLGMATRNLGAAFAPLFAVPGVDQRAVVMVAMGVLMQATFSFVAATYYGRQPVAPGSRPESP